MPEKLMGEEGSPADVVPKINPMQELGLSGMKRFSGYVDEEFLPQLRGKKAIQVYREMKDNDAIVGALLFATDRLLRQVTWRVEPASSKPDDKKAAEFVEECMADMCYDDQTQILTDRGWVLFSDLTESDRVAQRSSDGFMEFVKPKAIHEFDFKGELLGNQGDSVDFLVSPNHRMLFAPRTGRQHDSSQKTELEIHKAKDMYGKPGWVSKEVKWAGEEAGKSKDWLEFLGFFVADGSAADQRSVVLIQKDTAYVEDLLLRNGLSEKAKRREVNGSTQWAIHDAALARELTEDFGRTSRIKKLPVWLKNATPAELDAFLAGFIIGDGYDAPSGLTALYTSSVQLADDLQEIAMKAGYATTLLNRAGSDSSFAPGSDQYRVSLWSRDEALHPYLKAGRNWYKQEYDGKIHCVAVPSGVIMVRRNGKPLWSGNSHTWDDMLTEILSMLPYGWSWHEIVYKRRMGPWEDNPSKRSKHNDGKIGWRKMPIRSQETWQRWVFDKKGGVKGMVQMAAPSYQSVVIPMEKSLLFRTTSEKGNPEGRSYLRNAYRSWYMKKRLEEIEVIGAERDLAGMPMATVPRDFLSAQQGTAQYEMVQAVKKMVRSVRRNEQEGIIFPAEYDPDTKQPMFSFELMGSGGSRQFDIGGIIERYEQRILMSVLADFILVGHEGVGSYSMHTDKTGMFRAAMNSISSAIADVFNSYAIPRLFKVNGWRVDELPKIIPSDIDPPDLAQLGAFMGQMQSAGVEWFPDSEMEKFVRDVARLPKMSEEDEKVLEVQERQARLLSVAQQRMEMLGLQQQAEQGAMQSEQTKMGIDQQKQQAEAGPDPQADPVAEQQQKMAQGDDAHQMNLEGQKQKLQQSDDLHKVKLKSVQQKAKQDASKTVESGKKKPKGKKK